MDLPELRGRRVTLRPIADEDLDALREIVRSPGVREWWGPPGGDAPLAEDLRCEGAAWTIEVDGVLAGWLGTDEDHEPDHRTVGLDIVLGAEHQGRGLGPEAMRLAIDWLVAQRGHHRITIDPAVANERAIHAYRSVGFRPVGVMRAYERGADGSWHDNLLMDLLAVELATET